MLIFRTFKLSFSEDIWAFIGLANSLATFSQIWANFFLNLLVTLVSISPIFYEQLFHTNVFLSSFYVLKIWVCNFWRKDFGAKAARN